MTSAPIALLTDFGTGDPYVGAMKGVLLGLAPRSPIADITHEIPRHDAEAAAYALWCAAPWFPRGTVFVAVVDPGVGTRRRILLLRKGGRYFLAPDNGLLALIAEGSGDERWFALKPPPTGAAVSSTFHGRDLFAPAAARLANGRPATSIASLAPAPARRSLFVPAPAPGDPATTGRVLQVDRFGNLVTNVLVGPRQAEGLEVTIRRRRIRAVRSTYDGGGKGAPFLIRGSSGLLEISVNRGDASAALRASRNAVVAVSRRRGSKPSSRPRSRRPR